MSDKKSAVKETWPGRQTCFLHSRRMEKVRKNFAVGVQRITADRTMNRRYGLKTGQGNTA